MEANGVEVERAGGWRELTRRWGRRVSGRPGSVRRPIAFLAAAVVISGLVSPSFLSPGNAAALLTSTSFLVVLAVGEALVIMVGMIDLGVESVLAASGMLVAWLYVFHRWATVPAVVATLGTGAAIGVVAGLLVSRVRIPSFIVTLGTYWGFRGIALLFNGGNYINPDAVKPPRPFGFAGIAGESFGVSHLIVVALIVVVLAQVVVSYTPLGGWLKATGSSEEAARAVGLRTPLLKVGVFAVSGLLAALGGVMITAWQNSIYPLTGQGYSLEAIAAVILGGIPFTGGRGTVVGAALGALTIGVINDMIVLLALPSLYQYIFVAVILLLAGLQARGSLFVK
jgi:ribose transport system permease protein